MKVQEKIASLQELIRQRKFDAWIVPSSDPHQSEYVADRWKARQWLSEFTGSAGTLVVTRDYACLWTDSRYFIQAEFQLRDSGIHLFKMGLPGVPDYQEWLVQNLQQNAVIGFDGKLFSVSQIKKMKAILKRKNIQIEFHNDLVDDLWENRPEIPVEKVKNFGAEFAGEDRNSKFQNVLKIAHEKNAQAVLISALDDIAWTFNIRGSDIDYNPVVICYAIISKDESRLFLKSEKLTSEIKNIFEKDNVHISDYDDIFSYLKRNFQESSIVIDPLKTSQALYNTIPDSCLIIEEENFIAKMKSHKNEIEINGIRDAHLSDGIALVKWLIWLEQNIGKTNLTEWSVAEKLFEYRKQNDKFIGNSFDPIVGYKGNGAIVHYSAKPDSAAQLQAEGLLLVDTGGQYLNGTTDITRTISLGNISEEEKYYFTLVLKAHIGLSRANFPQGTIGAQLETFARAALWEHRVNYGHGTGHGVGHHLCVHEDPYRFGVRDQNAFVPGIIITNEPGVYIQNKFGIRIENLLLSIHLDKNDFGTFLGFETLSLCPIEIDLIDFSMLTVAEIEWLNNYHSIVYKKLHLYLNSAERDWLQKKTQQL